MAVRWWWHCSKDPRILRFCAAAFNFSTWASSNGELLARKCGQMTIKLLLSFVIIYQCHYFIVSIFSSFLKYSDFHIYTGSRVLREIMYHWNSSTLAPDVKDWIIWKDHDAEEGWRQEKGTIEDEMIGSPTSTKSITDLMDMSLSKLWESIKDRESWLAAVHGITKNRIWLSDWTELNIMCTVILWIMYHYYVPINTVPLYYE